MYRTAKLALGTGGALLAAGVFGAPAQAAPNTTDQRGLVNVAIVDTTVQVPLAVAANICDVDVNVLASDLTDGSALCEAAADATATRGGGGNNRTQQNGLVNIAVVDTTVQVPVGVAANLCDIDVNVLVQQVRDGDTECDAVGEADASG